MLTRLAGVEELREIGGELVLVHRNELLALNRAATAIWEMLAEPCTREGLVQAASRKWPGAPVEQDVDRFLARLADLGLVAGA